MRAAGRAGLLESAAASTSHPAAQGAKVAASVLEVADNSDVVFSIVGFPADVRAVFEDVHKVWRRLHVMRKLKACRVCALAAFMLT